MDPETLLHTLLSIHEQADSPEQAQAAAEWIAAQMEGEQGD